MMTQAQSDRFYSQTPPCPVMDRQQELHFHLWLEGKYLPEDRNEIEQLIYSALREYPDLLSLGKSWPEVLEYAS